MGLPRSTFYAAPREKPSDAEFVAEIRAITDEFECYGYRRVGAEFRHRGHVVNASWADSRRRYDAAYGIRRADDLAAVVAFFEARNARLHDFRWKDWGDYKSGIPSAPITAIDQGLGTGDGATRSFQLTKRYASGAQSWTRTIVKPVAGTVRVALAGLEPPAASWSVSHATGIVTFDVAPAAGLVVTTGFEFDVPVRFDTDRLDVIWDLDLFGSIASIPLVEVRR